MVLFENILQIKIIWIWNREFYLMKNVWLYYMVDKHFHWFQRSIPNSGNPLWSFFKYFLEFIMLEISFKTAEICSQFPAKEKFFWELGSQVPEENPTLAGGQASLFWLKINLVIRLEERRCRISSFHSIRQQIDFKVKIATLRSRWGDIAFYRNESFGRFMIEEVSKLSHVG